MSANDRQVGGNHYFVGEGEQHWDRMFRLFGRGYFIGCITKYVERYWKKGGKLDLEKAAHYLEKLIELEYPEPLPTSVLTASTTVDEDFVISASYPFEQYEKSSPRWSEDIDFQCEGGYGNGVNVYRCLHCRGFEYVRSLQAAHEAHACSKPR